MQDLLHLEKKPGGFHILTAGATSCFYNEKQRSSLLQKDVTVTPVEEKLLETLEELSLTEKFEGLLQDPPLRGSQRLGKSRKTDLVQSLSDTSSRSKGPSGSSEFEARGNITDSSDWTTVEPEVIRTDADEAPTYSLQSEAGKFECSVSDLRWVCEEKVSFKYQFCSWEEHVERMKSLQYMPAGPLLNIKVTAGKLNEVHLPHWICTDDSTILDKFAVLHIDGCGDVVEDVSEVTSSHVKLSEPSFSLRGVLMKLGFPVKIKCKVLIYYKPNTTFLKLHVYLIPHDPALQQMVDKKESSKGYEIIQESCPDMYLKMHHGFLLTADVDTVEIGPEKLTLRYDSKGPNFYEVFIKNPDGDFDLKLFHCYKKEDKQVWTRKIKVDFLNSEDLGSSGGATGGATSVEGRSTEEHTVEHAMDELSPLVQKSATSPRSEETRL